MKRILLSVTALLLCYSSMAQETLAFPFQGGKDVMTRFFKENIVVSPEIIQKRASGTVVFKFTADGKGAITKIVIYYADDAVLVPPIIEALKKSNHKWIIPDHEKFNDFIIPFSYTFNAPPAESEELRKDVYNYTRNRKPILSTDQVPLDEATLLPAVSINYDLTQ